MKSKLFYLLMCLFAFTAMNAQITSVAIVGAGVEADGWPGEAANPGPIDVHQLTQVGTTDVWQITGLTLVGGPVKFRANNSWNDATGSPAGGNWGKPATGSAFPTATAVNAGSSGDIPAVAGTYDITIDVVTGVYTFSGPPIPVVNLIGTAVTGGTVSMSTADGVIYTLGSTTLLAGNAQFEVDAAAVGATAFPSGTVTGIATDFIPVTAGGYLSITYNNGTGEYSFVAGYPAISIVGESVGGWPGDPGNPGPIDAHQLTTTDGETYTISNLVCTNAVLPGGGAKFRQDNAWATNWGNDAFPMATSSNGNNILTVAGTYNVTFTRSTGAFTFSYPTIAIVGESVGGWPGDPGNPGPIDAHQLTTTDGETYTISNLVTTAAAPGGGAKFRQDNAWANNWGNDAFPMASSSNGNNILTTAGTWNVTFTKSTGAFNFTPSLGVNKFDAKSFSAYPNPTKASWNIVSGSDDITSVQVFDILGKSVYAKKAATKEVSVNASELSKGVYFAKVSTANGSSTVKLVKE